MTTHLWWKSGDSASVNYQEGSEEARTYQINMAITRLEEFQAEYDCPIVLTGDFNANYTKPVIYNVMLHGYEHAHNIATEFADDDWGYHYCFGDGYKPYKKEPFENAIDHIFIKFAPKNFVQRFERYTPEYYLPLSDHSPVFVDVEL